MKHKVLVGAPIFDRSAYAMPQYLEGIKSLTCSNVDYLLVDNSRSSVFFEGLKKHNVNVIRKFNNLPDPKEKIAACRNMLAQKVLDDNYDYFLSLEQDVIPPKNIIECLLEHKKQVISGVYYNAFKDARGKSILLPLLYRDLASKEISDINQNIVKFKQVNPETYRLLEENNFDFSLVRKQMTIKELENKGLVKVKSCGLGCLLIHRSVLEKIKFRVNPGQGFDDMLFCEDLKTENIDIYADVSVVCRHLIKNKPWKWALK